MHILTPCQNYIGPFANDYIRDTSNCSSHLYRALAKTIQNAILSEKLKPNTKLLAHRKMSWQAGATIGTVTKAYKLLTGDWSLRRSGMAPGSKPRNIKVID